MKELINKRALLSQRKEGDIYFKLGLFSFCCLLSSSYIWIQVLCWISNLQALSPRLWLVFKLLLIVYFAGKKNVYFD